MSNQYLRRCSFVIADETGNGLDLSEFRVRFRVEQADIQTPNNLYARIYNLSDETSQKIQKEFTHVVLQAGYVDSNFGVIFEGDVKYFRRGRENQTDTFLDVFAADYDQAYNYAIVNQTLSAGSTAADHVAVAQQSLAGYGVDAGYQSGLNPSPLPRGKVMYGMARDVLRTIAYSSDVTYGVSGGSLQILPRSGYLPGEAIVLTADTGMLGTPEQTPDGIQVACLLNPNILTNSRVKIDNASINQHTTTGGGPLSGQFTPANRWTALSGYLASVANDGLYRVLAVNHSGDTRGNDWTSQLICLGLQDAVPNSMASRGLG